MNRLQKKCIVASTGVHLLLALILFIGPGFISSRNKPVDLPILNFVPAKTVDELVTASGGNPNARPPAAAPAPQPAQPQPEVVTPPPQLQPKPQPEKIREPDPPKEVKPVKQEEESLEPAKERQPKKIEISTTLISRKKEANADKKAREEAQAREDAKAVADARRRLARQVGRAAERIGNNLSSGTSIELQGPGGGSLPYANFLQAVKSVYLNAWLLPDGVVDDEAITVASVTIARDGTVVSARITQLAGDGVVDRSVQVTLDRVRYAAPLPDNSKEDQRTVSIKFYAKAKRSLG
jgi:outer membrane biosynthesis protein TonB